MSLVYFIKQRLAFLGTKTPLAFTSWGVLATLAVIQFALPPNLIMPRTYIGGRSIGSQKLTTLTQKLQAESQTIPIALGSSTQQFSADEVGIHTDISATFSRPPTIGVWDRLVPLKPLYMLIKKHEVKPVVRRDSTTIQSFAKSLSTQRKKDPVNANAQIKDGVLIITKDEPGVTYDPDKIVEVLMSVTPLVGNQFLVVPDQVPAKIQTNQVQPLRAEFNQKTAQSLKVKYGDTIEEIAPDTLKKWLVTSYDEATNKWSLTLNTPAVDAKLAEWAKNYNIAPGITQLSYYDDIETARKVGAPGRALDAGSIKSQLKTWFSKPSQEPIVLANVVVPAKIVATRTYSRSSAQLQAKLNAWIASHGGHYQIAIRELGGRGREASYNVSEQTVMASTYKIFLVFAAYRQAEGGALDLNAQLVNGKNINQCIEVMIVNSDNDCAVKLGQYIGWAKVDQIIAGAGFQNTRLNNYDSNGNLSGDKLVNANEQAKFLAQISAGSLINSANTASLLSYMKRQIYREGIPAGSRGAIVADKVGFLDGYIHDVGIVYGSKSTYALVIMSEGSSWANIRNLSQAVYDFMNE
jgi:beta-lactamase class A